MTKKTVKFTIFIVLASLIVLIFTWNAFNNTNTNNEVAINNKANLKDNNVVLEIDNTKISKKEFEKTKFYYNLDNNNEVEKVLMDNLIIKKLSEKEGINPTEKDVVQYIEEIKEIINRNPEVRKNFNEFLDMIGQNEKEYWKDTENLKRYKDAYIIGKYRDLVSQKLVRENPEISLEELNHFTSEEIEKIIYNAKKQLNIKRYY